MILIAEELNAVSRGMKYMRSFLRNKVGIIKGLRLQCVDSGSYTLWYLPLNIIGTEVGFQLLIKAAKAIK